MSQYIETRINDKWSLVLPEHRALRPGWSHWEYERHSAMYAAIRPGDVIVDVGAEEGDQSALYASWAGPAGGVILFEPTPDHWPWIREIFEANDLAPPIVAFPGFCSSNDERFPSTNRPGIEPARAIAYTGWPPCAAGSSTPDPGFRHLNEDYGIPSITLDDLLLRADVPSIDVITMDVEGAEYEVLLGAEETITDQYPILFVSVHPEFMWDRYHRSPDDLHVMLEKWGYDGRYLGFDHEQHWMFKPKASKVMS